MFFMPKRMSHFIDDLFEMDNALQFANDTYVDVNIFEEKYKDRVEKLNSLPTSCYESAEMLNQQREIYERHGVFSPQIIDGVINTLKSYNDKHLRQELENNQEKMMEIVNKFYHCG